MAAWNSTDDGSAPINFRAALAAFENNRSSSTDAAASDTYHSPKPRAAQRAGIRQVPATSARPWSDQDPVPRSCSAPRIRDDSDGLTLPSTITASSRVPAPITSASGMLSAPSPSLSTLRKTGSGTSLNKLMIKSVPRSGANGCTASALMRSRSSSVVENECDDCTLAPKPDSGRSSPYLNARGTLYGLFGSEDESRRTESPASTSQHMLDTSADDDLFAHAVMERSSTPASLKQKSTTADRMASLVPPQIPSRNGSASSTNSTHSSTPRLPPRRAGGSASLASSPTVSEFGEFFATAATPTPKTKPRLTYATYTPGAKRGSGNAGLEASLTPPALPPRSATLGQHADRATFGETPYQTRQTSPMRRAPPSVPAKPSASAAAVAAAGSKPMPPPRPAKAWDGAAGGFRFGAAGSESTMTASPQPAIGGPRPRAATASHQRSLTGGSNSAVKAMRNSTHRKSGSNVFTSISLSDDASGELKRSLESDLHVDHSHTLPPPSRGRPGAAVAGGAAYPTLAVSTRSSSASGGMAASGVVSSLIGTAASALPLFKSAGGATGGASRSLADGAPSKQAIHAGGAMTSRKSSVASGLMATDAEAAEAALWGRAVQLADASSVVGNQQPIGALLKEPKDEYARKRYEALFEKLVAQQIDRHDKKDADKKRTEQGVGSSVVTERTPSAGVQALRGWFESDASATTARPPQPSAPASDRATRSGTSASAVVCASTVRRIWTRSRLASHFLAQLWDQAVLSQSAELKGLQSEAFVKAMAAIDAALERKKLQHRQRKQRLADHASFNTEHTVAGAGRRVPPPPPLAAAVAPWTTV